MLKLLALLGAIAFVLYSVSGPVLIGFGVLAFVLIVLWQATKLGPSVGELGSEDEEERKDPHDSGDEEEEVSFLMGGEYNDDYEWDLYKNCINAWQFLLADAEAPESSTEPDRREELKNRAMYILSQAIKGQSELESTTEIVRDLLRLLTEKSNAAWLLTALSDLEVELGFDLCSELENSKLSSINDVLASDWEAKARSLMEDKRLSCLHSEEEIQEQIENFSSKLVEPEAQMNIRLTVYNTRDLSVYAGWHWGGTILRQVGLAKEEEIYSAGFVSEEWLNQRISWMGLDECPEFLFSQTSSTYREQEVSVLFDNIYYVDPGVVGYVSERALGTMHVDAEIKESEIDGPNFTEVSFSVGSNTICFFDESLCVPYEATEFLNSLKQRLNE